MSAPPLTAEVCEQRISVIHQCMAEGYGVEGGENGHTSATSEAARRLGLKRATLANTIDTARRYGILVDPSNERLPRYQQPVPRLHLVPAPPANPAVLCPSGEITHHLVIPDQHNDPRHPHRLHVQTWIARFGSELRPRAVINLGDAGTFDSVSRHDKDDTVKGRLKPSIRDDLENHLAALEHFERARDPSWKPLKKKARGNHEQRLWDYENANPASLGTHTLAYSEHLLQFGWQERPFGEVFYVDGIGYTHCPINGVGRAMGGKTAVHRAGSMLTAPLVYGHTHKFIVHHDPKIGETSVVPVIEAGCALPYGEVEQYALHSPTGWSYGVLVLSIMGGTVIGLRFVSMIELRARYSDDGADVRAA